LQPRHEQKVASTNRTVEQGSTHACDDVCIMSEEKLPNNIRPDESHGDVVPEGSPENALTEATADKPIGKMYFRYDAEHRDELVDAIVKAAQAQYDRVVALQAKKIQDAAAQAESKDEH
jgi:hypothetical protein